MNITYLISKFLKKVQIPAIINSNIDKTAKICSASHIIKTDLEKYSYIGNYCTINDASIGKFCSIADNCQIGGAAHPIDWVSSSPVFHEGKNILRKNFSKHNYATTTTTVIGNDVWIGNNSLIKSGVEISDGAIIGMGSVVLKDVGPYEIWGGNPAKLIRKRFDEEIITQLMKLKWWEWDEKKILLYSKYFNNPKILLNKLEKE